MAITPYATVNDLRAALTLPDGSQDSVLSAQILVASELIDQYCQRTFTVSGPSTRYYYVTNPGSTKLWVDDMLTTPTAVTVDGVALTSDQFEARPLNLDTGAPHYDHIVRLVGGGGSGANNELAWSTTPAFTNQPKVAITSTWGYGPTVPTLVQEACLIMAARLYGRRKALFANESGLTESGMTLVQAPKPSLDADCKQMLNNFVRKWASTGVWEGQ